MSDLVRNEKNLRSLSFLHELTRWPAIVAFVFLFANLIFGWYDRLVAGFSAFVICIVFVVISNRFWGKFRNEYVGQLRDKGMSNDEAETEFDRIHQD